MRKLRKLCRPGLQNSVQKHGRITKDRTGFLYGLSFQDSDGWSLVTKLAVHVYDRSTKDFIPNQCDLSLRERRGPLTLRRKRRHFFSFLFFFTDIIILHLRADDW